MSTKNVSSEISSRDHIEVPLTVVPPETFWFWELDFRTNRLFCSDELNAFLGVGSEQKLTPEEWLQYVHPEDRDRVRAVLQKPAEGVRQAQITFQIFAASGAVKIVRARAQFLMDDKNRPAKATGLVRDVTDEAETERLLRSHSLVMQEMRDAVTIVDSRGVITDINPAAEAVLGRSREELVGGNIDDFYRVAKVSGLTKNEIPESILERGYWTGECSFVRRDGTKVSAELTSSPIPDPESGKMGRVSILRDITERKQTDEALRRSQERVEEACRIARLGHWEFDVAARRFTAYGKVFFDGEETEYSFEDALRPIHPEDVERVRAAFERSFTEGAPYDETNRVVYDDGRIGHMRLIAKAVRDDAGTVVGLRGTTQDITEQKEAEEAMRRSEARLENAQRIAHLGSYDMDVATGQAMWSAEFFRIFGMAPQEIEPSYDAFMEFVHPDDRDRLIATLEAAYYEKEPYRIDSRVILKNGDIRVLRGVGEVSWGERGEPISISGTIQDITEQEKASNALRDSEQQLQQAQKMEAVGQLTGGIAHDFNNLLAVILGNLELGLELMPANSDLKPLLREGLHASERGAALTRQLLAFSRRQTLMPQPTDIDKLTGHMLGLARRTLGEAIEIVFEPAGELWQALVDPTQLENALLNLAINARDSMPDGGTLTIRTQNLRAGDEAFEAPDGLGAGDYLVVEVEDTGIGMSDDIREKVFEPFFTTKEAGHGSGLGLSMVYGFVKQSGGHVDIDSSPGKGTKIRLYLPRSLKTSETERETQTISTEPKNSGETVLIVEDDPHVRKLAVSLVERLGYMVLHTSEAESALDIMENEPGVDLVLSDVVLGKGMNGVELANRLHESWPNTKVLLMSGYAPETFMQDGGLGDTFDLISKPFKKADLAQHIDSLLH